MSHSPGDRAATAKKASHNNQPTNQKNPPNPYKRVK